MAIFKKYKNKKFDYQPRYYKKEGQGSPFAMKHKFDDYRSTLETANGLKAKFQAAFSDSKYNPDKNVKRRMLIIIAILVLIVLYIIDFDISIFYNKQP